ncbi:hypothetical protein BKA64DRAFT_337455 [Cadophora sp. MPI-SDFR-AT-0126]|nr:hypothetical protein BKA64DRAFT_337455 [Leotiomycetes sp. MPI-SDFR-AT-0126]
MNVNKGNRGGRKWATPKVSTKMNWSFTPQFIKIDEPPTMSSPTPITNTFPKFPLLPIELRRRIWEESLPRRVVEFPHVSLERKMALWEREICFDPTRPQPKPDTISLSVLGASYESYNTLNGLYKVHFGFDRLEEDNPEASLADYQSPWQDVGLRWARPYKGVRFNPKLDTLSMSTDTCRAMIEFGKDRLIPLRFVSVYASDLYDLDALTYIDMGFPAVMKMFLNAPNLELIHLVLGSPDHGWEEEQPDIHSEYVKSCGLALQDYWDTWRDTEGREMYSSDDVAIAKAQSDRKKWRSIVRVSLPD